MILPDFCGIVKGKNLKNVNYSQKYETSNKTDMLALQLYGV